MKVIEHFILLRDHYHTVQTNIDLPISKKDLLPLYKCTNRNLNLILNKLHTEKYIVWNPGRGRGRLSTLRFLLPLEEVAKSYIHSLIKEDRYTYTLDFIQNTSLSWKTKEKMLEIVRLEFGLKMEDDQENAQSIIKIPITTKLQALDPATVNHKTEGHLTRQIFDTLIIYNHRKDVFEPNLAFTWKESNNGASWTFYLRKHVHFHDGQILTTKDIKYTFQRVMDPSLKSFAHSLLEDIVELEVYNDWIVTFHLRKPSYYFLHHISSLYCAIVPEGFSSNNLIGTGPFFVKELKEDVVKLEAFADYFKEKALLDKIELRILPFSKDLVDYQLSTKTVKPKKAHNIQYGSRYVGFNFRKSGYHHHIRFREALRLLLDRKQLVNDMETVQTLPSNSFLYTNSQSYQFNQSPLDKAKILLQESGYKGEQLHVYYFDMVEAHELANWIQKQSKKIGLNLMFHTIPIHAIHDQHLMKTADMILFSVIFSDEEYSLYSYFKAEFGFLRPCLNDEQKGIIDHFLEAFHLTRNKEKRKQILQMIEGYLRENLFILFTYHVENVISYNEFIDGIELNSSGWVDFKNMWVDPLKSS
ncbi:MarR-like DNA-binding transcriptional regulator SgrR of sgrS sRNA [Salirhabdus euzebyi]|uniref:MarR-like DNA-binding transcriptional regulator SgrR of sgrS sRNA n=1 Tax=Salirhabdus euzebyi TaxID=394506 RepID=A0A841PXZ0_9BACI|nr:ABC transporter substrate-binding protein [Salirhabdus euzebyi]MBB6451681.1 MarR-like DNA-binding transcriptional regulator SgrR of sgrS sRNA [Salirhabdus euzebyi]